MKTTKIFGAIGMLIAALFTLPASAPAAPSKNSEAQQLWESIRNDANQAVTEIDLLASYGHQTISWETQANQLNEIRDTLNGMGAKIARLEELRSETGPMQPQVEKAAALLKEMAESATSTISFLNSHQQTLWAPEYTRRTEDLSNLANELAHAMNHSAD